jgi:hypothetical protein
VSSNGTDFRNKPATGWVPLERSWAGIPLSGGIGSILIRQFRRPTSKRFQLTFKGDIAVPKFMGIHTLPPDGFTAEQVRQLAQASQQDPVVKGYRSFCSLAEGKAVCILEAPDKGSVAAWFQKMGMPTDSITTLELEGERGTIKEG